MFYDKDRVTVYYSRPVGAWIAHCTIPGLEACTSYPSAAITAQIALNKLEDSVVMKFRAMGALLGYEVE